MTAWSSWDVTTFEEKADDVDSKDAELTGNTLDSHELKKLARP